MPRPPVEINRENRQFYAVLGIKIACFCLSLRGTPDCHCEERLIDIVGSPKGDEAISKDSNATDEFW
jgi:hypothetical protein